MKFSHVIQENVTSHFLPYVAKRKLSFNYNHDKLVLVIVSMHLPYLFPPSPLIILIFLTAQTLTWNTELVIFNNNIGVGEEQSIYH